MNPVQLCRCKPIMATTTLSSRWSAAEPGMVLSREKSVKSNREPVVSRGVRRRAGIKAGDQLEFKASPGTITINAVEPATYKATKAEIVAIRKGEAQVARGEYVTLTDLLHGLDHSPSQKRRKSS